MKHFRIYTIIALLTMTLSCFSAQAKKPQNLRLLYWNIQNGMWSGQTTDYAEFVNFVKEQNPDVCVWCEASTIYYDGTDKSRPKEERYLPAHWHELAKRYGHKYTYLGGFRDNYPQVITSRYPIEGVRALTGEGEGSDTLVCHGAGWARINVAGQPVNIVTVHTWPQRYGYGVAADKEARQKSAAANEGDLYRRTEMEYICRNTIGTVPDAAGQLWMMMGDFNSRSRVDNHQYHLKPDTTAYLVHDYILDYTPYIDVVHHKHPGEFITSTEGKSRIDFVYLTRPLYDRVTRAEIITTDYTRPVRDKTYYFYHPSDHRPIIVDFAF